MTRVRIPADVDRPDTLLAGLTARQLAMVAVPAVGLWVLYRATRTVVPLTAYAVVALPVCAETITLVVGRWHGLGADRFALAALRCLAAPRRQVAAPEGVLALPAWVAPAHRGAAPVPLRLPAAADVDPSGIVDLGADGSAVICAASAVNFALRTPEEQEALAGAFGRFLNALDGPVLILVSTARADLRASIERLDVGAADLPHPALEAAARSHATFLTQLTTRRELLAHRCFVVFRDPAVPDVAADTLGRRVQEAATSLAAAGVELTALNAADAEAALAGCADPDRSRPAGRRADPHLLIGAHRAAS